MVVGSGDKSIQRSVLIVVFPRFHLDGNNRKQVIIVHKKLDLAFLLVVVLEQSEAVRNEFAADHRFIHGTQVYASHIIHNGCYAVLIKQPG